MSHRNPATPLIRTLLVLGLLAGVTSVASGCTERTVDRTDEILVAQGQANAGQAQAQTGLAQAQTALALAQSNQGTVNHEYAAAMRDAINGLVGVTRQALTFQLLTYLLPYVLLIVLVAAFIVGALLLYRYLLARERVAYQVYLEQRQRGALPGPDPAHTMPVVAERAYLRRRNR